MISADTHAGFGLTADDPRPCGCSIGRDHSWEEFTATGHIVRVSDMAFADLKALFAADATFNIRPDRTLEVAP